MDPELKTEFARLHERLDAVDQRFDALDRCVDGIDDRIDRLTRGMVQQFEAQQRYMDTRFNEIFGSARLPAR